MLPTCTSASVKVLARYFSPLALAMDFSKTFPSKLAIEPSGLMVRALIPTTFPLPLKNGISMSAYFRPSSARILILK